MMITVADPDRRLREGSKGVLTVSRTAKPAATKLRTLVLVLLGLLGLVGCAGSVTSPGPFRVSCAGSSPGLFGAAATRTIPARIVHTTTATLVLVPVCLSGHGPYPFVLDTGATQSLVDRTVADQLQLASTGTTTPATGVGCTSAAGHVQVPSWSVGEVPLRAQTLMSLPMAGARGGPDIVGLLGSDVWSRFGWFQLDYRAGQVLLPGPEQVTAPTSATDPAPSAPGSQRVPMTVIRSGASTVAVVPVTIGGVGPKKFALDTGASNSVVDRSVAHQLSLPPVGRPRNAAGVSCSATSQPVHVASWRVGTVTLPPQDVDSIALPIPDLDGLVGSDVLYRFGTVTIDYAASTLVLGG
jgi:predicted aspartyl protease